MTKTYAVIGAGAGGLCAAKYLIARGVEVEIFELGSNIGGLWVYENDSGTSPAYQSLHINSEAKVSTFTDFPFSDDTVLYPNHVEMADYFVRYAEHFNLTDHIKFKHGVDAVERVGAQYRVTFQSGEARLFDGVVVATGHQSVPRHPPQIDGFTGSYLHAHSYRVPGNFTGQRVLVIGPGNSGVDIAADLCTHARRTVLSARSPVLIMPRMMFGAPNSRTLLKLERSFLPWSWRVWIRTKLTQMFHGKMENWGFQTPKGRTHPISHPTLIAHIAWRRIAVKPGIASVSGHTVTFTDGSAEDFDAIIAATGYTTAIPFVTGDLSPLTTASAQLKLYNRVTHPAHDGLYFIGFFDVTGGSNIRMMEDQAAFIAAMVTGAVARPSETDMQAAIETEQAWMAGQFPHSPRYGLELDPKRYRSSLARDYQRNGATPERG